MAVQQSDIDKLTAEAQQMKSTIDSVGDDVTKISGAYDSLTANLAKATDEIAALKAAAPNIDITALQAALDGASGDATTIKASADAAAAKTQPATTTPTAQPAEAPTT